MARLGLLHGRRTLRLCQRVRKKFTRRVLSESVAFHRSLGSQVVEFLNPFHVALPRRRRAVGPSTRCVRQVHHLRTTHLRVRRRPRPAKPRQPGSEARNLHRKGIRIRGRHVRQPTCARIHLLGSQGAGCPHLSSVPELWRIPQHAAHEHRADLGQRARAQPARLPDSQCNDQPRALRERGVPEADAGHARRRTANQDRVLPLQRFPEGSRSTRLHI